MVRKNIKSYKVISVTKYSDQKEVLIVDRDGDEHKVFMNNEEIELTDVLIELENNYNNKDIIDRLFNAIEDYGHAKYCEGSDEALS
jgi:prolyl-tRNA synthetase